jgi:hypothetical protein
VGRKNVYKLLVGKPVTKIPPGRPRRRRVDNIRIDIERYYGGGS